MRMREEKREIISSFILRETGPGDTSRRKNTDVDVCVDAGLIE